MCTFEGFYQCVCCDYKSNKQFNVTRHMKVKHAAGNDTDTAPNDTSNASNDTSNAPNDTSNAPNDTANAPNVVATSGNDKQCAKCNKVFVRRSTMLGHYENCKGKRNILQCEYCSLVFLYRSNKYNHVKICKKKKESDMKALAIQE